MGMKEEYLEKLKKVESYFAGVSSIYTYKENITIHGMKCKYVFYGEYSDRALFAIKQSTYDQYEKEIEEKKKRGLEKARVEEIRRSWIVKALTDSLIISEGFDYSTGITYYSLSTKIPKRLWGKVSRYFEYLTEEDTDTDFGFEEKFRGWVTEHKKVAEILKKEAQKIATQDHLDMVKNIIKVRKKREVAEKKARERKKQQEVVLAEIETYFKNAEKPDPREESPKEATKEYRPGFEKIRVDGERVDNPLNPQSIYGGGEWFVIQQEWIWYVQNNGHDDSNWALNNVETGGAGAIGVRVPYCKELAEKIRELKN